MTDAVKKKRVDRETPIHRAVLACLRRHCPDAVINHSPNAIGLSGKRLMIQIANNRANGTQKGFPDLEVIDRRGTLYVEIKAPGNYPDADQRALHDKLRDLGRSVHVVRSVEGMEFILAELGWIQSDYRTLRDNLLGEAAK